MSVALIKNLYLPFMKIIFPCSLFLCCVVANDLFARSGYPVSLTSFSTPCDTFDPQQRLPEGFRPAYPGRLSASGTADVKEARVDPPNWWIGMKNPVVELMIHDKDVRDFEPAADYAGIKILKIDRPENKNYLFVTLRIAPDAPVGTVPLTLKKGRETRKINFPLYQKGATATGVKGLTDADVIYLIMPDRFANGDPANDSFDDMEQRGVDRRKMYFRHGGDIQGVMDHIGYLKDLGVTALWMTPVFENDEGYESYHGYTFTDHYKIDKRFGTNQLFKNYVDLCHQNGMKVVMDLVTNHVGDQHYFIKDLPERDWIHQFDTLTTSNFKDQTIADPYASAVDRNRMTDGWFDVHMPDLNQQNPHLSNYLIQNNLWWIESTGLDAFRMDTYLYNDQDFMSRWGKALQDEYPSLGIFAETWVHNIPTQAQTTENNHLRKDYNSNLPGVTDFILYFAIIEALNKPMGWTGGVNDLYQALGNDYLYENPGRNVIFLDNHDTPRWLTSIGENISKYKTGYAWMLTTRGIPQMYYGDEILFTGDSNPDGKVRQDFPGGWKGDPVNKFTAAGRSAAENDAYEYVKKLIRLRKEKTVLQTGKTMQFVPENGVYTYFRYDDAAAIMVVINAANRVAQVDTKRFSERMAGFTKARNVVTGEILSDLRSLKVENYGALVLELMK